MKMDCEQCPKDDAYAAGRLAGLREAMEAVKEQWKTIRTFPLWEDHVVLQGFLAAIDRLIEK
jgi:hypothetical protein